MASASLRHLTDLEAPQSAAGGSHSLSGGGSDGTRLGGGGDASRQTHRTPPRTECVCPGGIRDPQRGSIPLLHLVDVQGNPSSKKEPKLTSG